MMDTSWANHQQMALEDWEKDEVEAKTPQGDGLEESQGRDPRRERRGERDRDLSWIRDDWKRAGPRRRPVDGGAVFCEWENMEGNGRRRTPMGRLQDRIGMETTPSQRQLDEEIGRAEEREEWRAEQWAATRREELFNEAKKMAEIVKEQNGGRAEDGT